MLVTGAAPGTAPLSSGCGNFSARSNARDLHLRHFVATTMGVTMPARGPDARDEAKVDRTGEHHLWQ